MAWKARGAIVHVAEANEVLAANLCDVLERAGYRVAGPFATEAAACAALTREVPALAVLGAGFADGSSGGLATVLHRHDVPFVMHAAPDGDRRGGGLGAFAGTYRLAAPASPIDMVAALDKLSRIRRRHTQGDVRAWRGLDTLTSLAATERRALERLAMDGQAVAAHTNLTAEGEIADAAYLLLEGLACRYRLRPNGARQIFALIVPGDLCGPNHDQTQPLDHGLATLAPCRIARIPHKNLAAVEYEHPGIARALYLARRAEEARLREWIMSLGRRSAPEKLAHLLCELHERLSALGGVDADDGFLLPLSQAGIADALGITGVHVNRTFGDLRRMKLVATERRRVRLLDVAKLRAMAEYRPAQYRDPARLINGSARETGIPSETSRQRELGSSIS